MLSTERICHAARYLFSAPLGRNETVVWLPLTLVFAKIDALAGRVGHGERLDIVVGERGCRSAKKWKRHPKKGARLHS
ncbi:MAG: hypothetical protein WCA28_23190 [Bradyrhizobium sp.]